MKYAVIIIAMFCSFAYSRPRQLVNQKNLSAFQSASISAQTGVMAHRGGCFAYEGVGFSTLGPDHALRNCCYYGQKTIVESAVVRGERGWFACVRYR